MKSLKYLLIVGSCMALTTALQAETSELKENSKCSIVIVDDLNALSTIKIEQTVSIIDFRINHLESHVLDVPDEPFLVIHSVPGFNEITENQKAPALHRKARDGLNFHS